VQVWQTSSLRRLRLREEKEERKKKKKTEETTGQKYNVRVCYTQGGHTEKKKKIEETTGQKYSGLPHYVRRL